MGTVTGVALVLILSFCGQSLGGKSPWNYRCQEKNDEPELIGGHEISYRCIKEVNTGEDDPQSLAVCKLACGPTGALWPLPTGKIALSKEVIPFSGFDFAPNVEGAASGMFNDLKAIFSTYLDSLRPRGEEPKKDHDNITIQFDVESMDEKRLTINTNESYHLQIEELQVSIRAQNYFGARHAVESLSQLVAYDECSGSFVVLKSAMVEDEPVYPHRGVLVDTSRNFMAVDVIKRIIDGLSHNKMNVFHWHITDTHSFPMEVSSVPELAEWGAYSKEKIYSEKDIKDIVGYGLVRGVKVLPEFDAPAHVGNGWQFAEEKHPEWGRLAVCVNQEEWQDYCVEPPCGQFNIVNEKMYEVLGKVYGDMLRMFEPDMFHMGGDEVNFNCWNSSVELTDYMKEHGKAGTKEDYLELWREFQTRAYDMLVEGREEKIPAIIWTNSMTEEGVENFLSPEDYIIQIWTTAKDKTIPDIINKGYRTIFSNYDALYLDCGYSAWVGEGNNWCTPYKGWQLVYDNSPRGVYRAFDEYEEKYEANILGGEVAMWSEQVQGTAVESKIFPRAAALGERLWSDPPTGWKEAENRINNQRELMVKRGIAADALQPEWCHQNEALCYVRK